MTCFPTMETQHFKSDFVPDTAVSNSHSLPPFAEIANDPETAYYKLTGEEKENATPDMCLTAYAAAVNQGGNTPRFRHVESNFIKALANGYICEVQEASRIKDAGVLVGLNEYDRPGSVIPLVDGSDVRRAPDALVVYTDNVGCAIRF